MMGKDVVNLIVAGVGGQGSILASHIIADAAVEAGYSARVGETYGAAMRVGAVHSHIRIGKDIKSPLIAEDEADVLIALEPLEALRVGVKYLSKQSKVLLNPRPILPADVNFGFAKYPSLDDIYNALEKLGAKVYKVEATKIALEVGNIRTANVVMLGALAALKILPFEEKYLKDSVLRRVPPKTVEVNERAFDAGKEAIKRQK